MSTLEKRCMLCGKMTKVEFTDEQIDRYYDEYLGQGKCVQNVFPELPPEKREFLITGMCKKCQHEMFDC